MPEDQIPKSMNYKSYQTKIVEQCGVVLVGYPGDKGIVNPGELDAIMLKELLARLNDGRCYWKNADEILLSDKSRQKPRSSPSPTSHLRSKKMDSPRLHSEHNFECDITSPLQPSTETQQSHQRKRATKIRSPVILDEEQIANHAVPMVHHDSPQYFPESPESSLLQTPDSESFSTTMNALHQPYLGTFASFFSPATAPGGLASDFVVSPFTLNTSDFRIISNDGSDIPDSQQFTLGTPFLPSEDIIMGVSDEQASSCHNPSQEPIIHQWINAWNTMSTFNSPLFI